MILEFEKDTAEIYFTPEEGIEATMFKMNVYAKDKAGGEKQLVHTSPEYDLGKERMKYSLDLSYSYYNRAAKAAAAGATPLPNILELSFAVLFDEEESDIDDIVEVHFVRYDQYLPQLMNLAGFTNGEKLMRIWFTKGINLNNGSVNPEIDIVDYEWAYGESWQVRAEAQQFLRKIKNDLNAFFETDAQVILRKEIGKMITDGLATMPIILNQRTSFGVLDKTITTVQTRQGPEKVPQFEKYYFYSKPFGGILDVNAHGALEGLDDFIAALASLNFHLLATGELFYEEGGFFSDSSVKIQVKSLGIFIKDDYDFIDDDPTAPSQPLGYWKIVSASELEIKTHVLDKTDFYEVTNEAFRAYRDIYNMGYNYHVYSTIQMNPVDIKFTL